MYYFYKREVHGPNDHPSQLCCSKNVNKVYLFPHSVHEKWWPHTEAPIFYCCQTELEFTQHVKIVLKKRTFSRLCSFIHAICKSSTLIPGYQNKCFSHNISYIEFHPECILFSKFFKKKYAKSRCDLTLPLGTSWTYITFRYLHE